MFTSSSTQLSRTAAHHKLRNTACTTATPLQQYLPHDVARYSYQKCSRKISYISVRHATRHRSSSSSSSCSRSLRGMRPNLHLCRATPYEEPRLSYVVNWQGITPTMLSSTPLDRKQLLLAVAQQASGWDQIQWDERYTSLLVILPNLASLLQRLSPAQLLNLMERPGTCAAALVNLTDMLPAGCDATRMAIAFPGLLSMAGPKIAEVLELARVTFSKEQRMPDDEFAALMLKHPNLLDLAALKQAVAESMQIFKRPGTKMTLHLLDMGDRSVYITASPVFDAVNGVWCEEALPAVDLSVKPV